MIDELRTQLERARDLGFLGPGPVQAHVHHAEQLVSALEAARAPTPPARALDLGSGGGVPGLVLAIRWGSSRWVLLDANERRTAFLSDAVSALGLADRVEVVRDRAEHAGHEPNLRAGFDLVTARSFGPPATTAECGAAFVALGGLLAVSEPPEADDRRWPADGIAQLGLERVERGPWALFRTAAPLLDRFPRRDGAPLKRPLWVVPA